jgi:hypothetical protein
VIVYTIANNRYCENIQRQHKSNHILIIADLNRQIFYQKCLDPDCRLIDFRSTDKILPPDICPSPEQLRKVIVQKGGIVDQGEETSPPPALSHTSLSDEEIMEAILRSPKKWP